MVAARVLIAEDDLELRTVLLRGLTEDGFSTSAVGSGRELLQRLGDERPDLLVLDIGLPMPTDATSARPSGLRGSGLRSCFSPPGMRSPFV